MEDFLDGGIETAMAFKGLPIGVGNGLAQHDGFLLGAGDAPAAPGCEHTAGAVEQVLLPGGRNTSMRRPESRSLSQSWRWAGYLAQVSGEDREPLE